MTELAYLADMPAAYERRFSATIRALPPGAVVLDRTFFYPAGGGQPCDRGTLRVAGADPLVIVDVVKSGPSVVHRLARGTNRPAGLRLGAEVEGVLDWARRHRHMRLHTAQHLVSAVVFERTGLRTRHATLAGSGGTIDLEGPWPADRAWSDVLDRVAEAVERPRPVAVEFVPRADWERAPAARSGMVPLPAGVDPVRVIVIEGFDRCPCGGTHARSTGEIGPVGLPPPAGARVTLTLAPDAPSTPPG